MLCKQQNAALRRGLHAYTVGFSVRKWGNSGALRTAMEGGREKPG